MLRVLRQRNFALLWTAGLISIIGDWTLIIGLNVEVYRRTGSTLATAGILVSFLIPSILLGSIAGVFVDRWDRRRLMIVVNLLQAVAVLPLLLVDAAGIWITYGVLLVSSALEQLFQPAEVALLPNLLEGGESLLVPANALSGLNRQLARIIGPVVGGIALAAGGLPAVTIIEAASFVIAAGLIAAIRAPHPSRAAVADPTDTDPSTNPLTDPVATAESAWRRLASEWRAGLAIVWRRPILRAVLVFVAVTQIGEGLTGTLFVPWVTDALHADAAGYGALISTQAIGGVLGALAIGRLGARIDAARLLATGATVFGLIDLVLFTYPAFVPIIAPAFIGIAIVGVPAAAIGAGLTTLQQTGAPDSHRGRVVGAIGAVGAISSLVGAVGAGVLGEVVPVIPLLIVQGGGYVVAGVAVWRLTRRDVTGLPRAGAVA